MCCNPDESSGAPVGVSATTGMVRDVMRSYSANPGYRSACSAYLSSRSAPCRSVACASTMSSPISMRTSGLAFRFQYQAGFSSAPALEANTRYRSPSARYIMMLVRGFPLRAPTVCSSTIGAPSNGPLTRPWLARNSAILRSLKSLPSLIVVSSRRRTSRTGPNSPKHAHHHSGDPRSRSQHQLAAGVAQFKFPVRVPHIVEGEDSGDRHFQLTSCDEVGQLGDHRCGRGIRTACRLDPEPLHGIEIGDGVDPVALDSEVLDRHGDISTTEEIQQGVDVYGLCCGAQPGRQVVTIVDRDRAMLDEPGIVGRPADAEDRGPGESGELNRDRTDTPGRARDRHRLPRDKPHRPHLGVGAAPRHGERPGNVP